MVELGNVLFGNSRGEYPVPRGAGYEEELQRLFCAYAPPDENDTYNGYCVSYGVPFSNNTFEVRSYYWGDCECTALDDEERSDVEDHDPNCPLVKPNFRHIPSGLEISWYKYPLRGSYSNQRMDLDTFQEVIDDCIQSLHTNPLRVIRYKVLYGSDGCATFRRTHSHRSYVPRSYSKDRFIKVIRRSGHPVIPNHSGWTLIVKR